MRQTILLLIISLAFTSFLNAQDKKPAEVAKMFSSTKREVQQFANDMNTFVTMASDPKYVARLMKVIATKDMTAVANFIKSTTKIKSDIEVTNADNDFCIGVKKTKKKGEESWKFFCHWGACVE